MDVESGGVHRSVTVCGWKLLPPHQIDLGLDLLRQRDVLEFGCSAVPFRESPIEEPDDSRRGLDLCLAFRHQHESGRDDRPAGLTRYVGQIDLEIGCRRPVGVGSRGSETSGARRNVAAGLVQELDGGKVVERHI